MMVHRIDVLLLICIAHQIKAEVDIITEPRPGEEFVMVSSGQEKALNFESSHKIPEKLTSQYVSRPIESYEKTKKQTKEYVGPVVDAFANHKAPVKVSGEGIISIEESKKPKKGNKVKVKESIEIDVPASKLEEIKIKQSEESFDVNPNIGVDLEAMSESGRLIEGSATTTQKPTLTTFRPSTPSYDVIPFNFDSIDDINSGLLATNVKLEPAGSEQKQHSRIQIKKGPNGQDYEYEYIYYYEDDDEDTTKTTAKPVTTSEPVHNSHDGPQKTENDNKILKTSNDSKYNNKYSNIERTTTTTTSAPTTAITSEAQNEVLPTGQRSRYRGRNLSPAPVQEEVNEERLPASTRFPPRSRNLNTTPPIPEAFEPVKQRGRPQFDSLADESIGQTRSRTRAHVRRPSSELVDLASFNTHSSDIPLSQYKELPSRFSAEGKTSTKNTETTKSANNLIPSEETTKQELQTNEAPREAHSLSEGAKAQEIVDDSKKPLEFTPTTASYFDRETTEYTTMMAMEKVALDLYAYLAGENLNNDFSSTVEDIVLDGSTTEMTTQESTTEAISTTEATTTQIPTTTTTTTPAPTTTTTTQAPTRASRFKNRAGARGRGTGTISAASTTETPVETSTKLKGRFSRPSFGAARHRLSTAAPSSESPAEETVVKQESTQTNTAAKAVGSRSRFGGRTRPTPILTTASTPTSAQDSAPVSEQPRSRLRPAFHLRERRPLPGVTSTTAAASSETSPSSSTAASVSSDSSDQPSEAPAAPVRSIGRGRLGGLRPLRPGPRLNIGRGASTTATPAPSTDAVETPTSVDHHEEAASEPTEATSMNPLQRLRGRPRLHVAPSAKPKVAPVSPVRRPNPLISRRKPNAEASEAPTEAAEVSPTESPEESTGVSEAAKEEPEVAEPVETTPAPKPLSNLLARRRLVQRRPGTVA